MVSFVVLHYKSIEETLYCLECLKNTFKKDISIIVVDNNSLSEDEVKKIKKYTKDIVLLDENKGFAKANNIGCSYAIEKYNPDFLCVINNDVFIEQEDFIDVIYSDYDKYKFDMLGPYINSRTGESCNPFPIIKDLDSYIQRTKKLISIYSSPLKYHIFNFLLKVKKTFKKSNVPTNGEELKKNVGLHCCAIIFSKKYYLKYEHVFYDDTFLFHEEEFLYRRMLDDKLITIYDPLINVYHKEGSSVSKSGNLRLSKLFKEQEKLKSLELLREYRK